MSSTKQLADIRLRQAARLGDLRRNRKMTQAQLAKLAGVTPQQISKYESARDAMSAPIWELMVSMLGGLHERPVSSGFSEAAQTPYGVEDGAPSMIADCVSALREIADRLERNTPAT